jgi:long-chain acyl-CoA synthetase
VVALFAASAAGAWAAPVNARMSAREIDAITDHAGARRVVFTSGVSVEAMEHAARHGASAADLADGLVVDIGPLRDAATEAVTGDPAKDACLLVYTSGTTGAPKGVMLSHRAALFVASGPGAQRPLAAGDLVYGALPIAHIYGLTSTLLRTIYGGAHIRLMPRFDAADLADALAEGGVTLMQGVPQMYAKLIEWAEGAGFRLRAPDLKFATIGGAFVEPDLKAAAEAALGIRLTVGYGMTEFASTVTRSLPEHVGRDICAGPPLPGIEVRIAGAGGEAVAVGEAGEIWLRGPNCMLGYYRNPEATAAVLTEDGWYKTGDMGRVDAAGSIHFAERAREIIIRSGFNVHPVEVETVLSTYPGVTLSAVVGRAVPGNEEVVAFVQPAPGAVLDPMAIQEFCADRLAPYKRPAEIVVLDPLPAAPTGKILKNKLKDLAASR